MVIINNMNKQKMTMCLEKNSKCFITINFLSITFIITESKSKINYVENF